jgi:hypothetical protein
MLIKDGLTGLKQKKEENSLKLNQRKEYTLNTKKCLKPKYINKTIESK